MEATFIAALACITSISAYYFGARVLGLSDASLRTAVAKMLESVGLIMIFLALNLGTAVAVILVARGVTGAFVSAYVTDDTVWVGLSIIQGLAFQWWRGMSPASRAPGSD